MSSSNESSPPQNDEAEAHPEAHPEAEAHHEAEGSSGRYLQALSMFKNLEKGNKESISSTQ